MALSLTLGAVSAEDIANDETLSATGGETVLLDESGNADGGDVTTTTVAVPTADVEADVEVLNEVGDEIIWSVAATNYGPDTAFDTIVSVDGGDNLLLYGYI